MTTVLPRFASRRGFTLVELMAAVTVFALVAGGVLTAVVAAQRMACATYYETELALNVRALRERILFHVAPPHDNTVWSGLLSGTYLDSDGNYQYQQLYAGDKITLNLISGIDATGTPVDQTVELLPKVAAFVNDGDRIDDGWNFPWLRPSGLRYLPDPTTDADSPDPIDAGRLGEKNLLFVNLVARVGDEARRERIAVPVFGQEQKRNDGRVFHDAE